MSGITQAALNSASKYPSIETYHALGERGRLIEEKVTAFPPGSVVLTEKVNGANGRIILLPGNDDYFIGSREELLYASGDRIVNPQLGIVETLIPVAERLLNSAAPAPEGTCITYYLEVYGHPGMPASRNYTSRTSGLKGARLFDVCVIDPEVLTWEPERIASWRDRGGQHFLPEEELLAEARFRNLEPVPRLGTLPAAELPRSLEDTQLLLFDRLGNGTRVMLEDGGGAGAAEGIVLRTPDRREIRKARFEDYARTLRAASGSGGKRG